MQAAEIETETHATVPVFVILHNAGTPCAIFFARCADRDEAMKRCLAHGDMAIAALRVKPSDSLYAPDSLPTAELDATSTAAGIEDAMEPLLDALEETATYLGDHPVILSISYGGWMVPKLVYPSQGLAHAAWCAVDTAIRKAHGDAVSPRHTIAAAKCDDLLTSYVMTRVPETGNLAGIVRDALQSH